MTRKPSEFSDLEAALRMRDIIYAMAKEAIQANAPGTKFATVQTVDRSAMRASVIMESDVDPVSIPIPNAGGPYDVGDLVLVDISLGAMKITRVVYSPSYPGGVYIKPGLINPTILNPNGQVVTSRAMYYAPVASGTAPFLLGRWTLDPSAVFSPAYTSMWGGGSSPTYAGAGFHARVKLGNSRIFDFYDAPSYGSVAAWTPIAPESHLDSTGATGSGSRFGLEYRVDLDDAGNLFYELRARVLSASDPFALAYPWRIDIEVEGNYNKDENYPFGATSGTYNSAGIQATPGIADTGAQTSTIGWTMTGGGSPVHSLTSVNWRLKNGRASFWCNAKVGGAITVAANGDLGASLFGYVPPFLKPQIHAPIAVINTGTLFGGYVSQTDGSIILTGTTPGTSLAAGTVFQFGASWDI